MRYQRTLIIGSFVLILVLLALSSEASARTLVVSSEGKGEFRSIQVAVSNADPGDTIRVWDGVYNESVVSSKSLEFIGNGSTNTLVDGGNGTGFHIEATQCTITGFSVTGDEISSFESAIKVEGNGNLITDNRCFDSHFGIYLFSSQYSTLTNNSLENCGLAIRGDKAPEWNTHIIGTNNSVNGKPLIYLSNMDGGAVPGNAGQIVLGDCHDLSIQDQVFQNASMGMVMGFCSNISVVNTSSSEGWDGAWVMFSDRVSFLGGNYSNNACDGLFIDASTNTRVMESVFSGNKIGINFDYNSFGGEVHGCRLSGNLEAGINAYQYWNQHLAVNATGNWWGSPLGPYHPLHNPVKGADNATGNITTTHYLHIPGGDELFVEVLLLSGRDLLDDQWDLNPGDGYLDIFFGDDLLLEEWINLPDEELPVEDLSWQLDSGETITGERRLNITVGGNIFLPDSGKVLEEKAFVSSVPEEPEFHNLSFSAVVEGVEYTRVLKFRVSPLISHRFDYELQGPDGELLHASALLEWRGFEEEVASNYSQWEEEGKVWVELDLIDPENDPRTSHPHHYFPSNCSLQLYYRVQVYGTTPQGRRGGISSLELTLPFTNASVERYGRYGSLRKDVAAYRYNWETTWSGINGGDHLPGFEVDDEEDYLRGGVGSANFDEENLGEDQGSYFKMYLGLAIKSIWTGEKKPDLVITRFNFSRDPVLLTYNGLYQDCFLYVTVEAQGDVYPGKKEITLNISSSDPENFTIGFSITFPGPGELRQVIRCNLTDGDLRALQRLQEHWWEPFELNFTAWIHTWGELQESNESNNKMNATFWLVSQYRSSTLMDDTSDHEAFGYGVLAVSGTFLGAQLLVFAVWYMEQRDKVFLLEMKKKEMEQVQLGGALNYHAHRLFSRLKKQ